WQRIWFFPPSLIIVPHLVFFSLIVFCCEGAKLARNQSVIKPAPGQIIAEPLAAVSIRRTTMRTHALFNRAVNQGVFVGLFKHRVKGFGNRRPPDLLARQLAGEPRTAH